MIIKMNSKLILGFSVLLISFQCQGQNIKAENSLSDVKTALKCIEFIQAKTLDFNKELYPVPCTDIAMLLDSL
mgnify:CR=1 FL=1